MGTPFIFGKFATSERFTNRKKEIKELHQAFEGLANTILISPRRWGKSSLMAHAAYLFSKKNKQYKIISIDLFSIYTEQEFYERLATETIKATSNKVEEWAQSAVNFLSKLKPNISVGNIPHSEFEISLALPEIKKSYKDILDLPERIAKQKGYKLIICIDEFQNIERLEKDDQLQKRLRSHWQQQQNVMYCLYGSKRHMLMQLFESASKPFYKFGNVIYLKKISVDDWIPFIVERFDSSRKKITPILAKKIAELMKEHPYYVQQLCSIIWHNTTKIVTEEIIEDSLSEMLDKNDLLFQKDIDQLSKMQLNYICALANGEIKMTSKEIITKYQLSSSANVIRIIKSLEEKEIINKIGSNIEVADPAFEIFIKRNFKI